MDRLDFLKIINDTQRDWDRMHCNGWDRRQMEKTPSLSHYQALELENRWNAALVAALQGNVPAAKPDGGE
jgi:hypothetical protein